MSTCTPTIDQLSEDDITTKIIQRDTRVIYNLGQNVIVTTEDKIRLCLAEHLERMANKKSWAPPLAILLTILIIFPTTTFKDFIIGADVWEAIFIISGIISGIWFLICVREAWTDTSVDKVVEDIKRNSSQDTGET
jgi:hypothetical protein